MDKKKSKRLEEKGWRVGTVEEFLGYVNGKVDPTIIKKGPYKGKKIVCASTEGVDSLRHVAVMFIKRIFKLEPDAYFITDEARLRDFTDFGSGDVTPILRKIKRIYGLDVSDIANGNLLEIFRRIDQKKPRLSMKDFDALLKQVRRQAKQAGLKRSDISEAIQNVRLMGRIPPQDSDKIIEDAAYLEKREAKGSRRRFERVMKKVRDVKPAPKDDL